MTNDSIDNLRLDLNQDKVKGTIYVRIGDTRSRTIHISLVNSGKVVSLDDVVIAELLIKKPDNTENDQTMVVYGNELQYTFRTQDVNVAGECICQVMLTYSDSTVVTSPKFSVMVYTKAVSQTQEKSTNEYTAITQQLVDAITQATNAATSATSASTSADTATIYSTKAESYAVGDTDYREGEATDNAKYFYEQTKAIAEGLQGSLLPQGTITFEQLASKTFIAGYEWNISDDFISDSRFNDGGGIQYAAGTNVYVTGDLILDCLTGSAVTGVKGSSETVYRKGYVSISKDDIGLANVDNTTDLDKPVSTATQSALNNKQDKLTNPLTQSDVVNSLTSKSTITPLSAAQGKALKDSVDGILTRLSALEAKIGYPISPSS